jgi:hypothetical protein
MKTLDWTKRADQQGLAIGDTITVDATVWNLVNHSLEKKTDSEMWTKTPWGSELAVWAYNPDDPSDEFDANAPIGVVVCKIYNPSQDKTMRFLRDLYPDTAAEYPTQSHVLRFVGRVSGLQRQKTEKMADDKPPLSLRAVHLSVDSVTVIEATRKRPE